MVPEAFRTLAKGRPMPTNSSSSDRDPLDPLAAEFLDHSRRGENPSPSVYAEQYPQWAEQLREFFPALALMEGLKPATGDRTALVDDRTHASSPTHAEHRGEYCIAHEIGQFAIGVVSVVPLAPAVLEWLSMES